MKKKVSSNQLPFNRQLKPLLIVLSGPSGVGKDSVLARMKESGYPLQCIATLTTRPRRPIEEDKVDYHFVSAASFKDMIAKNELLEWAEVYGNWYGVPKEAVRRALEEGQDVAVKVDVQGAATIKKLLPQAVFIFLAPPSTEELLSRLRKRSTEAPAELARRLGTAEEEMKTLPLFDYVVVNRWDEIDRAVAEIKAIIAAEKCRVTPREISL